MKHRPTLVGLGLILSSLSLGHAVRPADGGAPPAAKAPVYFDRPIKEEDLAVLSQADLAMLRNTIYAHAGRRFRSPELQSLFAKQPWYVPRAPDAVKLTPLDRGNLRTVLARERQLRSRPIITPCPGSSGTSWTLDAPQQKQLKAAEGSLAWQDGYDNKAGACQRAVTVTCGPDLDGDGAPEFIIEVRWWVLLNGEQRCARDIDSNNYWQATRYFLATRKDGRWVGIAPLGGASDEFPGTSAGAAFVRRKNGHLAVNVSESSISSDDETESSGFTVFELQKGKLREVASGVNGEGTGGW